MTNSGVSFERGFLEPCVGFACLAGGCVIAFAQARLCEHADGVLFG